MPKDLQKKTLQFIEQSRLAHGDKYDYSKVEYVGALTKVCIICPEHGPFYQIPNSHKRGKGCQKCGRLNASRKKYSNTKEFIQKAKKQHGNKYDYSKVKYERATNKISIICLQVDEVTGEKHGEFLQKPSSHLSGGGCPKCSGNYMNHELFVKRAKIVHKEKYDYSKVQYKNAKEKVIIICPDHGPYTQVADGHLRGSGCPKCANKYSPTTQEWVRKAMKVHGDRYDYSQTVYNKSNSKVSIHCKEHGLFRQTPSNHLMGKNCPKCTGNFIDRSFFLQKANEIYRNKKGESIYDYSLVNYVNSSTKVTVICNKKDEETGKKHGEFAKTPNSLLSKHGCPKCGMEKLRYKRSLSRLTNEDFVKKAFHDEFEYLTNYKTAKSKIHIKCKKCGSKFWQKANNHLMGAGCPVCNMSRLERRVCNKLKSQNIPHEMQKRFKWLGRQSLDFYLPDFNMAIECQGIQHFESKNFFGGEKGLSEIVERDFRKLKKCLINGLKMIYVVDNKKYFDNKYHFDVSYSFDRNISYRILHVNDFDAFLNNLIEKYKFLDLL